MLTNYKGAIYLSAAAIIWGGMYVSSKYVLDFIPPLTLLCIRYILATFILIIWCRWRQVKVIPEQDKGIFFQMGFFGYFLSIAAQFIGTKFSTAHMGAVITTLSPVFQSGFAILLLGEKMTRKQVTAMGLSFIGVMVITGVANINRGQALNSGNLFFLGAAALWGYYSVLAKKVAERHSILCITTMGMILGTMFTIPIALTELNDWDIANLMNPFVAFSIFYLAFFSTVVAYYCWNKGIALTNPHRAGLFFFLQAIAGSVLGCVLLGETLSFSFFLGSLLVLLGVYLVLDNEPKQDEPV